MAALAAVKCRMLSVLASYARNTLRSPFCLQSRTKCIGLTIETRPDYCLPPHLNQMLSYGCTRCHSWRSEIYNFRVDCPSLIMS